MVVIIDYGMGNPGSIKSMLRKLGVQAEITSDKDAIGAASKLILPGVGAFDAGMSNLRERDLVPLLERRVLKEGVPILGVCLGMHLMTEGSEEGVTTGLGWIAATAKRFIPAPSERLKVPHMGWASVKRRHPHHNRVQLLDDRFESWKFYFVHSYYVACRDEADVMLDAQHGIDFVAGFEHQNIFGVQFHPEKSHKFGLALYENFVRRF